MHGPNAIRMWLVQSHYSQPIEYSEEILEEKRRSYERLQNLYTQVSDPTSSSELSDGLAAELRERFDAAMEDDLNTPEAVAALFEVAGRAGREISARPEAAGEFGSLAEAIEEVMTIFGFDLAREHVHGGGRRPYQVLRGAGGRGLATDRPPGRGRGARRTGPPPTGCATSSTPKGGPPRTRPKVRSFVAGN